MSRQQATKKDRVVEELRALITSGRIPRGSRVRQEAVGALLDVSITPVREAFRQLEAEGLLYAEPNRGVRVASANLDEVKAVYVIRRFVEPYAVQRATRRVSRRDLDSATQLIEDMAEANARGELPRVSLTNEQFHFLLYDRCGIPALGRRIRELWLAYPWDVLQVLRQRAGAAVEEHRAILAAVESGEVEAAKETVEQHIRSSYLALAGHLRGESADPFHIDVD